MISLLKSKSDIFNRRALFLSADKLSVYHWNRGELGSSFLFDIDDAGRENFKRYLSESVNLPMTILLDVIEEEYRQDTIPHVFGSDRESLIERKLARLYRDANYSYTQKQGREKEGRRDERLLFMALTNNDILKPWIDLLDEHKVPLRGILSIPLLLQSYIKTLPDISDNALFVTMQSISGLRQTYFQGNELKISRLSRLPRYGTVSYVPNIHSELEKIQRYLNSLRLIPSDESLDVYIMADRATLDEMENDTHPPEMMRRHYFDISKIMETTAQGAMHNTPFSDQLLIHHLLKTQTKNCYASSNEMRYSKMRNMRYSMNIASVFLLIFSIIFSGLNFMGGITNRHESESAKNKSTFYQARYDLARERLPKTPVESEQVKIAVEAANTLEDFKSTPYEMLGVIGKGLEQYPNIMLDDMDWNSSTDPNMGSVASSGDSVSDIPVGTNIENNEVKYYQISNLKAHIEPFDGNYREAIAIVNKFAETLRGFDSTYDISIESFPLDISSTATLEGDVDTTSKEAMFALRAVIGVN